jgi:integrase
VSSTSSTSTKTSTGTIAATVVTSTTSPYQYQYQDIQIDKKIEQATEGLAASCAKSLYSIPPEFASVIADYIKVMRSEVNPVASYRRDVIGVLTKLSKFHASKKTFKEMSREDVLSFLDSFRKTEEEDPLHKWVGTYNHYRIHLLRFFKWLYSPEIEHTKRNKPAVVDNVPRFKRKEISIYKPTDLWTPVDDLLFLKYCPGSRERCYHAISRDLSCRPSEILRLKIKDVVFRMAGANQYAEVVVNGKTGTRPLAIINALPYLKDYLDHEHPMPRNPKAPLICGMSKGIGRHLTPLRIAQIYRDYKERLFPALMESPNVLSEDKQKIRELLKKPWNPYIRRHSAITEKSMILKEGTLRQHAGWSPDSKMVLRYVHYYGNESSESLLEAYGLFDKGIQIDQLKPKQCPNCSEPNKPDSKFCNKCRMVLTYDAYNETLGNQKQKESEVQLLRERYEQDMKSIREEMNKQFGQIMSMIQQNPQLAQLKPEALTGKTAHTK